MTGPFILWAAVGAGVGVAHAKALRRAARHERGPAWYGVAWRLPLVGITLVVAAVVGRLLPAVTGWVTGLAIASVIFVSQRRWM